MIPPGNASPPGPFGRRAALARRSPVYYGWVIVALGIAGNMVSAGAIFWGVTLYVPAIAREFAVDRTPVVTSFMLGQAVYALMGPVTGRYIDRHGSRRVILAGSLVAPLAILVTSQAHAVWQLLLGWVAVSMARTLLMPIPFNWVITRWFEGRSRQGALGVVTVGFGLGGAVMLPILSALERAGGWRLAMAGSGIAIFAVYLLAFGLVVSNRPSEVGLRAAGDGAGEDAPAAEEAGFSSGEAIRDVAFWLLASGLMLFFLGQGAVLTLAVDFFDSRAITAGASLIAASALIRALARAPFGFALSRIRRVYLLAVLVTVSQAVAITILVISTSGPALIAWVAIWGLGGAFAPMLEPLLVTNAFGVRHYGAISGLVAMIAFGGQVFGPIGGAVLFDATGSYDLPFLLYGAGFAISGALFGAMALAVRSERYRRTAAAAGLEPAREPGAGAAG